MTSGFDAADFPAGSIAVIGMAGRFPGASDIPTLWQNLRAGRDAISHFRDDEMEDRVDPALRSSRDYVRARPCLDGIEAFDAAFFDILPREAALIDPQQRVMLECAWECMEDAGYNPAACPGAVGVFAGASLNTYFLHHVLADRGAVEDFTNTFQVGNYATLLGAGADFLATRIAYKLNLRGPAMTLGTGCSTSLLAVAQACQSLQLYQCDMALAGGVSISFPQRRGYLFQEGGMVSPDGRCRPFDALAAGTVFGSGAGIVLLKRVEDALADRDRILAVIRGAAVNNDGAAKAGFTAPSVEGQAAVIAAAHVLADVEAGSIGYVECHGTATPLGDPIEFAGLDRSFRATTDARGFCALGSVKANLGHLDAAAGVVGLIKAVLVLRAAEIPALLHYQASNPAIDLDASPFFIPKQWQSWPPAATPRRAGVSSFGVGGTNVHLVVEEAPAEPPRTLAGGPFLLPLSARTPTALARAQAALADHLVEHEAEDLADVAHTLQTGRRAFPERAAFVCRDRAEAIAVLRGPSQGLVDHADGHPEVVFLFPGQGSQYPGMGRALYRSEPTFRDAVDRGAEILRPLLGLDIRTLLYGQDTAEAVRGTVIAQPALFLTNYALARTLMGWGIRPDALAGHSIGEMVAATLAGVFDFEDALRFVAERGRLMQALPGGAMLAVRLPEIELASLLGALPPAQAVLLDIAALNAPALCVVAGPWEAVGALETILADRETAHRRLQTSHAFHSAMMDPVVEPLAALLREIRLRPPKIPCVSGVTGDWLTPEDATAPDYWGRHCRSSVRFADVLTTLSARRGRLLLEVGPGRTLSTFAAQSLAKDAFRGIVSTLPEAALAETEDRTVAQAAGRLWASGAPLEWAAFRPGPHRRLSLPTYPFERRRHWIDPPAADDRASIDDKVTTPMIAKARSEFQPDLVPPPTGQAGTDTAADGHLATTRTRIVAVIGELSGLDLASESTAITFLELGLDSLVLAQLATQIRKTFGVTVTFRQMLRELASPDALVDHVAAATSPAEAPAVRAGVPTPEAVPVQATQPKPMREAPGPLTFHAAPAPGGDLHAIFRDQLTAMQNLVTQQCGLLAEAGRAGVGLRSVPAITTSPPGPEPTLPTPRELVESLRTGRGPEPVQPDDAAPGRHGMYRPGAAASRAATPEQTRFIADLVRRYNARTPGSKAAAEASRPQLADPRTVAGFRQEWKDLVYPILSPRSKGSRIWDVDGNDYVDLVNGFGQTAFGHAPDFVTRAVADQLEKGYAIGPQTPLAGACAALFCSMTGHERVTFCNTGSEAVMAAMRVARTVTGRDRVVVFEGDYHGQFDEVLVQASPRAAGYGAVPVAPGIPRENVTAMTVLPYLAPESLDWIARHAGEIAAVVVEPVQSRQPAQRPAEFLRALRALTETAGIVFVMDEVITGFRVHPGGMQAELGIQGDLATYGKVVGGGMPIGILAGKAEFMDALDGGQWRYGDDSGPEVAPTFFAGTFVRHPLALAAVHAVLVHLKAEGPALQERLSQGTAELVASLNDALAQRGLAPSIARCGSWFMIESGATSRLASLLFPLMRLHGVHVMEHFPCFLTTAHDAADRATIVSAFTRALDELQAVGILEPATAPPADARPVDAWEPTAVEADLPDAVPATAAQMEIWLAAQRGDEASCAFNESVSLHLSGSLDPSFLADALDEVVARHDSLRGRFSPDGSTLQIGGGIALAPLTDLSAEADPQAALAARLAADAITAFDLVRGPLLRTLLVKLAPDEHVLVLSAHHIVCDGWSMNIVLDELAACVAARETGVAHRLPAAMSFRRYALAEAAKPQAGIDPFWSSEFADSPPVLDLPADRPRRALRSFAGATYSTGIAAEPYRAAKAAAARNGATLFSFLLATVQILFGRLSGQNDVVIAVPAAAQSQIPDAVLVGHCVNLLPLRSPFAAQDPFRTHLSRVQAKVLLAYEHQDVTLGTLVRALAVPRDLSRLPLTGIQFNLERLGQNLDFGSAKGSPSPNAKAAANFDIFLNVIESVDGLRLDWDYRADLFDASTIARWSRHLETLLAGIIADPATPIAKLPLLAPSEVVAVSHGLHEGPAEDDATVDALVARQAEATPDAPAVSDADTTLTYRQLEARADGLAALLRQILPIPGARIALATARGTDMVAAMLAIMKAGHAYVPLDPAHPPARSRVVLAKAEVSLLICDSDETAILAEGGLAVLRLDAPLTVEASAGGSVRAEPGATAYVIFTSGSTGEPKGVEIRHRSVVNLLRSMARRPGFSPGETLLAVTTTTFDISVLEVFLPLIAGGRTWIASREEVRGGFGLVSRIETIRADVIQATPSLWQILTEAGFRSRPGLRMLSGGEPLSRDLADRLLAGGGELWNLYGPTETTIWSSVARIQADGTPITIGDPIADTRLLVLDSDRALVPPGVAGDLWIGGAGLARGYFGRPDLTARAFREVDLPDMGRTTLYRTGDLARRRADGSLELLGRVDDQIKLRGFRIELGEIEAAIRTCRGVAAAATKLTERNGGQALAGYFVAEGGSAVEPAEVARHVALHLPDYMVPATWTQLDALPLTLAGKLDRAALPEPDRTAAAPDRLLVAPRTPREAQLAAIWSDVLAMPAIDIHDNIFALGADSLQIFRIAARMIREGLGLEAKDVLRHPTIAELAALEVADPAGQVQMPALRDFRRGTARLERAS